MTLESSMIPVSMIPVSMKKKKTGFGAARLHFSCNLRQFLSAYTPVCTAGCLVKATERASFAKLGRVTPRASASLQPVVGGPVAKTRRWACIAFVTSSCGPAAPESGRQRCTSPHEWSGSPGR